MTRDEILAMQPGPELDELLQRLLDIYELVGIDGVVHGNLPLSSTWEGMRLVVEAMAAKGWYASIQWPIGPSWAGKCYAVFVDSTNVLSGTHTADTAPHAVAIAARLALEGNP